jgi:hypothetical protein
MYARSGSLLLLICSLLKCSRIELGFDSTILSGPRDINSIPLGNLIAMVGNNEQKKKGIDTDHSKLIINCSPIEVDKARPSTFISDSRLGKVHISRKTDGISMKIPSYHYQY